MRRSVLSLLVLSFACAHLGSEDHFAEIAGLVPSQSEAQVPAATAPDASVPPPSPPLVVAPPPAICPDAGPCLAQTQVEPEVDEDEEGEAAAEPVQEEAEPREPSTVPEGIRYSVDLSDEVLRQKWKDEPAALGSISIGFADEGRLVNGRAFPAGDGWKVVSPTKTWATTETVDFILAALREVRRQYPEAPPLRVNQMSGPEGGYLPPHKSHQNGRDVDLAFFYRLAPPQRTRDRYKYIDPTLNWALVKALVMNTDVQLILVDRRIQKVLYDHALKAGEDRTWLNALFRSGRKGLIRHARRHRDHFHVRFYNGRAQELGRRVAPLLALRPEQNITIHRVRPRQNLGLIARKYGTTVNAIKKTNHMRKSFLRVGQPLKIVLRGPCTRCPVPPAVIVPTRLLPPATPAAIATPGPPNFSPEQGPAPAPVELSPKPAKKPDENPAAEGSTPAGSP